MSSEQNPVAWLRAQVEADLARAKHFGAVFGGEGTWVAVRDDDAGWEVRDAAGAAVLGPDVIADVWREDAAEWIPDHDPREVVADCEAKLAILHEYELRDEDVALMLGPDTRRQREWDGLRLAVRLLLGAYRHREEYRPEWQTVHGLSLATMRPSPSTGRVEFLPEAITPAFAAIKEGDIVNMDGRDWRVAKRSKDPDGGIALDLLSADARPEGVIVQGSVEI